VHSNGDHDVPLQQLCEILIQQLETPDVLQSAPPSARACRQLLSWAPVEAEIPILAPPPEDPQQEAGTEGEQQPAPISPVPLHRAPLWEVRAQAAVLGDVADGSLPVAGSAVPAPVSTAAVHGDGEGAGNGVAKRPVGVPAAWRAVASGG